MGLPPRRDGQYLARASHHRYLTDRPQKQRWLPEDEKAWLISGSEAEVSAPRVASRVPNIRGPPPSRKHFCCCGIYFLVVTGNQGSPHLPSIHYESNEDYVDPRADACHRLPYLCSIWGFCLMAFGRIVPASNAGTRRCRCCYQRHFALACGARRSSFVAGDRVLLSGRLGVPGISARLLDLAGRLVRPIRRRHGRRLVNSFGNLEDS